LPEPVPSPRDLVSEQAEPSPCTRGGVTTRSAASVVVASCRWRRERSGPMRGGCQRLCRAAVDAGPRCARAVVSRPVARRPGAASARGCVGSAQPVGARADARSSANPAANGSGHVRTEALARAYGALARAYGALARAYGALARAYESLARAYESLGACVRDPGTCVRTRCTMVPAQGTMVPARRHAGGGARGREGPMLPSRACHPVGAS
jgi:hypothetical protein